MALTMIVLAAGMGSRFGGPKQLVPIGPSGETILDYNTHDALAAGFDRLVVVTRPELEAEVARFVERGPGRRGDTRIALQRIPDNATRPLGTTDAVVTAAPHVDDSFAVANSDDLYGPRSFGLLHDHLRSDRNFESAVVGFRLADTMPVGGSVTRALLERRGDHVARVVEVQSLERVGVTWSPASIPGFGPLTGAEDVSLNLWGFHRGVMELLRDSVAQFVASGAAGEIYLPEVVGRLVAADAIPVRVIRSPERWAGLTNPDDVDLVRSYAATRWPSPLWS
jgi:bifunctional N-acetylglucosamine-1-phosphate-uridyltransferase/glucosamine-1-phosphate-acetyltransferase GlmU-like protein